MQARIFDYNGVFTGLVIHRYRLPGSACKFSVWYDEAGRVTDAERISRNNTAAPPSAKQLEKLRAMSLYDFYDALNIAGRGDIIKKLSGAANA